MGRQLRASKLQPVPVQQVRAAASPDSAGMLVRRLREKPIALKRSMINVFTVPAGLPVFLILIRSAQRAG